MQKPNLIITACNQKYGDFLINHWLRSIVANIDLSKITIAIIDYGLLKNQKSQLIKQGVMVVKGNQHGHITTNRFVDAARFLSINAFKQVLFVDSGDVLFQKDISHLFEKNITQFRACVLETDVWFLEWFINRGFSKTQQVQIYQKLKNKPVINAGMLIGPNQGFIQLGKLCQKLIVDNRHFGPDQIVVNYLLYQWGVEILNRSYNYMPLTIKDRIVIKGGVFYENCGEKIAIIHNAGGKDWGRPIINFGIGQQYNQINYPVYWGKRTFYDIIEQFKPLKRLFIS